MSLLPTPSSFTETFVSLNCPEASAFFRWYFQPGMLFQDNMCWWKSARRLRYHEGVDFCGYRAGLGDGEKRVGNDLVPTLYDGVVVKIDDDFLGKTVWNIHESIRCDNLILFSALGHIAPEKALKEGDSLNRDQIVGRIAPRKDGSSLAMHLHLSVFWAPSFFRVERLCWQKLQSIREIQLFDPLSIVSRSA